MAVDEERLPPRSLEEALAATLAAGFKNLDPSDVVLARKDERNALFALKSGRATFEFRRWGDYWTISSWAACG